MSENAMAEYFDPHEQRREVSSIYADYMARWHVPTWYERLWRWLRGRVE